MVPLKLFLQCFLIGLTVTAARSQECGVKVLTCNKNKSYRRISGACNNLENPNWGTAKSVYDRLLPPKYGKDDSIPVAVSGNPLPNPRYLSSHMFNENTVPDPKVSLSGMQYGQFVAHDMSFTFIEGNAVDCCNIFLQFRDNPPESCASVEIPNNDPYYAPYNITCIPVVKASTNKQLQCSLALEYTEQITATTSYLDLSVVYGNTNAESKSLRSFIDGKLLSEIRNGNEWLTHSDTNCPFQPRDRCYRAGDSRVDQGPHLAIIQTIWAREHNRLATELKLINPNWNDDQLFHEARRIAIAKHQYITYHELLPNYLGKKNMEENGLLYKTTGYIDDYDPTLRPHVLNEHAQGAFRHFHSMIVGGLNLVQDCGNTYGQINIRDHIGTPHVLEEFDNFDGLSRGLHSQPANAPGISIVPEVTRFAFLVLLKLGLDIKSVDIQRARIHGLASYNDMREYCGIGKVTTFEEFIDVMDKNRVNLLKDHYEHPDDVDLIIGGAMERRVPGTLAGPTFLCIMLKQFYRTRKSDRFWFENQNIGFTNEQLNQIRKVSISKLFCDNGNDINLMQRFGFLQVSPSNPLIPCDMIPGPDLTYWNENKMLSYF